jgi:hypothetical protein
MVRAPIWVDNWMYTRLLAGYLLWALHLAPSLAAWVQV